MNALPHREVPLWKPPRIDRAAALDGFAALLDSGRLRAGYRTVELESQIGEFFDRPAVAVGSGMDALELLLEAFGVRDRRVLIPAHAFQAIPALVVRLGGHPVPVPIDPASLAPQPGVLDRAGRRAVVIWIHHTGITARHARATIEALRVQGATVIEDGAYLLPTDPDGPGTWGDAALLSFAPTKPMSGTGGAAVITCTQEIADLVWLRRTHSGVEGRWAEGDVLLRNRAPAETDALIATAQWQQRDRIVQQLQDIQHAYTEALLKHRPELLPDGRDPQPTWGRYLIDLGDRTSAQVRPALSTHGIATSVTAARPWTDYPALAPYRPLRETPDLQPLLDRTLALPYHPALSPEDVQHVAEHLLEALDHQEKP
ncbi:DegT/DnrJ/EryC1/StrS family aminotransferase [Kitasatospora sp. NRRL B-11411]|uniref:DegT/DnrJ/EryC1/StrS family aminotransferase n=1 Tax=Kitasatospora sp. NRRL B-11411 TaxID=1463822 RepID=UPI0004C34421|nr:DegT/DnrJ/EryC1/StrS family aminotransferase [Kitasatospora sp. NRRL B-11411]